MKYGRAILATLFACLLTWSLVAITAAQSSGSFDLAITAIEPEPFAVEAGDTPTFYVTYANLLVEPVPRDTLLDLALTVINVRTRSAVGECRQPLDVGNLTADDPPQRVPFAECSIALPEPATYLLRAEFVEEGAPIPEGAYDVIPGDVEPSNNGLMSSLLVLDPALDGELPAELTRVFAGLAIFFAVMALMAGGTEVVIDSLKVAVGLKSKVTSMEALDRMAKYLPGELAALSVSAASREQFRRMAREMRTTLDLSLHGLDDLAELRRQVASGVFGQFFRRAQDLLDESELSPQDTYALKKHLHAFANQATNDVENKLYVDAAAVQLLREQLAQEISMFDGAKPEELLQRVFELLHNSHFWSTQIVDGWLKEQESTLFARNSAAVLALFESEVRPLLEGIGFAGPSVDLAARELVSRLRIVEAGLSQMTDSFITGVKNVLDAVEIRRYETQSPARKVWRVLRGWSEGAFPPVRLRGLLLPALLFSFVATYLTWLAKLTTADLVTAYLVTLVPGFSLPPLLPWFLLYFAGFYLLLLLLYLFRRSRATHERPWLVGLYGATALALLLGALAVLLLWALQPSSLNRVSGQLLFFNWIQPWWSWFILLSGGVLLLLLLMGQLGKLTYDHLVRKAIAAGQTGKDPRALDTASVLERVETLGNLLRTGFDISRVQPERFGQPGTVTDYEQLMAAKMGADFRFSSETAAQFILERNDQQRDEESSRLRLLRLMSILVGLALAYLLQIDVLALLGEAFPGALESINLTLVSGEVLHTWRSWLPADKVVTVGIILTAFAASAGSAFWHDRLDKLQASKKTAQAAAQLLTQASQVMDTIDR